MSLITKQSVDAKGPWSHLVCPAALGGGKVTPAPSITKPPARLASVCSAAMPRRPGSWSLVLGPFQRCLPGPRCRPKVSLARTVQGACGLGQLPLGGSFRSGPPQLSSAASSPCSLHPPGCHMPGGEHGAHCSPSALLVPSGPRPPQRRPVRPRGAPAAPLCLCSGPSDNSVPRFRSICFVPDFHGKCVRP